MIATKLPKESINGIEVRKLSLENSFVESLCVEPYTRVLPHDHNGKQWEVYLRLSDMTAYVCLIGETHELVNNSNIRLSLLAIKGTINYSYYTFKEFFSSLGFSVYHESLIIR